ncbi:uncharacterized protein LOC132701429 [Cylas formicarius]|uniref:uncharacterized protein LOC132701429 n=1 Tax=Cylas formicarius TaxID=197179 RepID=UPI0029583E8A|nr:uncharacterized protein LOC132701429 [Cylas formicarius]
MENVDERVDVRLVSHWENIGKKFGAEALIVRPNFKNVAIFSENLVALQMKRTKVIYDEPIYARFCILDISKTLIYDFFYGYLKAKYGDKAVLLYTGTDSLVVQIFCENFYDHMKENLDRFDTSNYSDNNHHAISVKRPRAFPTRLLSANLVSRTITRCRRRSSPHTVQRDPKIDMANVIFFLLFAATKYCLVESLLIKTDQGEQKSVSLDVQFGRQKRDILNDYVLQKKKSSEQKPATKMDIRALTKPLNLESIKSKWKSSARTNLKQGTLRLKDFERRIKELKINANPRLRLQARNDFPPVDINGIEKMKTKKEEMENLVNKARLKLALLKSNYSSNGKNRLGASKFSMEAKNETVGDKNVVEASTNVPAIVVGHSTTMKEPDSSQTVNENVTKSNLPFNGSHAITFGIDALKNRQQQTVAKIKDKIKGVKGKGTLKEFGIISDNNDIPKK